ncbi:DUF6809 family protein [Clostridium magnum]|uniref:DUF6809 family protein n=1 Tax=Clostridium magnum TaxID=33954 RepID=UPI00091CF740|nr:DUF6809 family protein [Clostridium magnum]SHJ28501.1 hypothetical protein SAMN02745944_05684 [Clostridium magnum DSM 2767]
MGGKVDVLYKDFQENGLQKLQKNPEYQETSKKVMENMHNLKNSITIEQHKLLNKYDDSLVELHGIMLKEYYEQGFKDGRTEE